MDDNTRLLLIEWAETYNDPKYFEEDPIAFPRRFAELERRGERTVKDVEVAAIFAAHFAWGRRAMIVRDCGRLFDEMDWRPYDYVMKGEWRCDPCSIHRTVKWSEVAAICSRLKTVYEELPSIECLSQDEIRDIGVSGLLHDLGKSNIPLEILNKPGKLDDDEFALMK